MESKNEGEQKVDEIMLPGFRFHPTDEELVGFYLKRKVQQRPLSIELIKQIDIYKFDPWDLPKMGSSSDEKEWYFYCPRDRKYRNSTRPNRVTGAGFWKATGTDRPIYSSEGNKCIGLKKSLVFYKGRAAKGVKTDWMMHEFRLPSLCDSIPSKKSIDRTIVPANDSWAICRIFKKTSPITPRTISNSWVSPTLPTTYNHHHHNKNNHRNPDDNDKNNYSPTNSSITNNNTTTFPMQSNPSNINDQLINNILNSPNNFSCLDNIPTFDKLMYPRINNNNNNNIENKPSFEQQFLTIPPMLDLHPSYILPQLEDPCELSKSSIDISSMLLNIASLPNDDTNYTINNFGEVPSFTNDLHYHANNVGDNNDFRGNLEGYQEFQSALLGNSNSLLHCEDEPHHLSGGSTQAMGSFSASGLLPLVWDCAPMS